MVAAEQPLEQMRIVPLRHPWRWVGIAVIALVAAQALQSVVTNDRFQWGVVFGYLFSPTILDGLVMTIALTAASMVIGLLLGVVLAAMRTSRSLVFRSVSSAYIWF